ncbi:Ig-like domain-containing protein [Brevibacillus nitrificans]|nr:Ig-like domain-containing protein [Brevibacillus nitrificans]
MRSVRSYIIALVLILNTMVCQNAFASETNDVVSSDAVTEKELTGLKASKTRVTIIEGETASLMITATYKDKTTEDVTSKVTWTSSKKDVATVEKDTINAKKVGSTTLKATYASGGKKKTVSISVSVKQVDKDQQIKKLTEQVDELKKLSEELKEELDKAVDGTLIDDLKEQISEKEQEIERLKKQLENSSEQLSWETYNTKHMTINLASDIAKRYEYIPKEGEEILKTHEKYFGANSLGNNKITLWIHGTGGFWDLLNNGYYMHWLNAIKISTAAAEESSSAGDLRFSFAHEMAHAYQIHKWENLNSAAHSWLIEGQADYVAKKLLGFKQYNYEKAGKTRDLQFYIDDTNQRQSWGPTPWDEYDRLSDLNLNRDNYFAFEAMVFFLDQNYGGEKYNKLLERVNAGDNYDTAFLKVYGKSSETLMAEYKKYFKIDQLSMRSSKKLKQEYVPSSIEEFNLDGHLPH